MPIIPRVDAYCSPDKGDGNEGGAALTEFPAPPSLRNYLCALPSRSGPDNNILVIKINPGHKYIKQVQGVDEYVERLRAELQHIPLLLQNGTVTGIDLVAVDLNDVDFVNSQALGAFIGLKRSLEALNLGLVLYGTCDNVYGVFAVTGLTGREHRHLMDISKSKTLDEALGGSEEVCED